MYDNIACSYDTLKSICKTLNIDTLNLKSNLEKVDSIPSKLYPFNQQFFSIKYSKDSFLLKENKVALFDSSQSHFVIPNTLIFKLPIKYLIIQVKERSTFIGIQVS